MTMTNRAAGILFIAGEKILLMQRQGDCDFTGTWGLPFGKIESGETPEQAAIRECLEETGFIVVGDLLPFADDDGCITHIAQVDDQFEPMLNDEHSAFVWASLDALPLPLHPQLECLNDFAEVMDFDDTARMRDINGFVTIKANPISKVGVYPYLGSKIPGAPEPDRIYFVYRPAEELSDPECIESFKLMPWTDSHPLTLLGPEEGGGTSIERKPVQGVMGENIFFDGDTLFANLKVFSEAMADLIDSGKTELSAGYRSKYEWTSGVWNGKHYDCIQRCLRGNHLALVETGRMGPEVSVLDHMTFTIDSEDVMTKKELMQLKALMTARKAKVTKAAATMDAEDDPTKKDDATTPAGPTKGEPGENPNESAANPDAVADAGNMTVTEAMAAFEAMFPLLEKLIAAAQLNDAPAADTAVAVDPETMAATMDAAIERAQGKTFDRVVKHMARRDQLAAKLSDFVGTFDAAEMTEAQVAAYGIEKLELKAAKGQELAVLEGYFQAAKAPKLSRHTATFDGADIPKENAVAAYIAKAQA